MTSAGVEWMETSAMRNWIKPTPPADDPLAFRWWTFGVLVFYTAALLVLCALLTIHRYTPIDGLRIASASAGPPHLPITIAKIAHLGLTGPASRTVCYQLPD
jgi:hypothetical protein